jgi:hypothetical protein
MAHLATIIRKPTYFFLRLGVGLGILVVGCAQPYKATLSPDLANQINDSLSFSQIKELPDEHKGKLVILGGQILSAKRLQHSTELIILQLPLIQHQEPTTELTRSEGRYIAYQQEFLDPATVPPGTRITLVGELSGSVTQNLDLSLCLPVLEPKRPFLRVLSLLVLIKREGLRTSKPTRGETASSTYGNEIKGENVALAVKQA